MGKKILGESVAVIDLLRLIHKVAATKTNILIVGESGTGKELVARMIHDSGPLKGKAFVPVNCGAIPETLIESEMFGHKRGSFTGAIGDKQGLFEAANGGTLFLDEVGELPVGMQVKLLRAIQDRYIRKVGGTDNIKVDVRIIAATNRDLEAGIANGAFREDLYYRLNVIQIKAPPLRERKGDVQILAEHFLKMFAEKQNKKVQALLPEALQALESYSWPGNIRELENVIERAVTLEHGEMLSPAALPFNLQKAPKIEAEQQNGSFIVLAVPDFTKGGIDLDSILGEIEKKYLLCALEHSRGVKKKAAESLSITFRSMRYRLKKLGIEIVDEPEDEQEK